MLVVLSKIYFLYKNLLTGFIAFKLLFAPSFFSLHFQNINNNKNISFSEKNKLPGKKAKSSAINLSEIKLNYNEISEIERVLKGYGLVDLNEIDKSIIVELQYATSHNFLGKNIYGDLKQGYLQKDVAIKLHLAAVKLCLLKPEYNLVVLDAARPLSLQKLMWNEADMKPAEKEKFLSNPFYGSLHNYGAAVDVTLSDSSGKWLDFGTDYDSFDELSYPALENIFLNSGKLTQNQVDNRKLLRLIMKEAGFSGIETEWWHFNSCSRVFAKKNYPLIISHIYADNPDLNKETNIVAEKTTLLETNPHNINFRVQIMTSANPLKGTESIFKDQKVDSYYHNGLYKYTSGKFRSLEEAHKHLVQMQNLGFTDAFIIAFDKNKRIGIRDASEFLQ